MHSNLFIIFYYIYYILISLVTQTLSSHQYIILTLQWQSKSSTFGIKNEAKVTILISDEADLRARKIIRDKGGYCIMINGSIFKNIITIFNVHVPHNIIKLCEAKTDRTAKKNI